MEAPTGVVTDGFVTATIQLEVAKYPQWQDVEQFYSTLLETVRGLPGIEVAGTANAIALEPGWRMPFAVEGRPPARQDEAPIAQLVMTSSGYFETFRARLVAGRFFADTDKATTEPVVVINETMAQRLFNGEVVDSSLWHKPLWRTPTPIAFRSGGFTSPRWRTPR